MNMQAVRVQQPQRTYNRGTAAFGYDNVQTATLRFTASRTRVASAAPSTIALIATVLAALARPEYREGLLTETFRAAFAGFAIFGGALFMLCSVAFGIAYVAAWMAYGAVRHVVNRMNEGPRNQKVLALYALDGE